MDKLKPCPFCGDPNPKEEIYCDPHDLIEYYYIRCTNDLCFAQMGSARKREWAIKRWNRRAENG